MPWLLLPLCTSLGNSDAFRRCDFFSCGNFDATRLSQFLGAVNVFRWEANQFDRLAAGSLAGHLIECGAQVCQTEFSLLFLS